MLKIPEPVRVYAEEDTETGEHVVFTEDSRDIGNFIPSNDGGFVCWSSYVNESFTATNELEAVQKIHAAYEKAAAEEAARRG